MIPRRCAELEDLLPGVVAFEVWGDGDPGWLMAEERRVVDGAVGARVVQFASGRECARQALATFEVEPAPILRSVARAPAWPTGFVGSISHTEGYAIAVVGRPSAALTSVGVDAERVGRVREELYGHLFVASEQQWLSGLDSDQRAEAATTLFGLKESYYKAQFPLTGAWVGFHDVAITDDGGHWVLDRATDLDALMAVSWPCTGRSLARQGIVVSVLGAQSSS